MIFHTTRLMYRKETSIAPVAASTPFIPIRRLFIAVTSAATSILRLTCSLVKANFGCLWNRPISQTPPRLVLERR